MADVIYCVMVVGGCAGIVAAGWLFIIADDLDGRKEERDG